MEKQLPTWQTKAGRTMQTARAGKDKKDRVPTQLNANCPSVDGGNEKGKMVKTSHLQELIMAII